MFSDPQFWVLIAFIIFIGIIFNPIRKILLAGLDSKINDIKESIDQAEKLKNDTQQTLSEIKKRQNEVKIEIQNIQKEARHKISLIENNAHTKLKEQINKRNDLQKIKDVENVRLIEKRVTVMIIWRELYRRFQKLIPSEG